MANINPINFGITGNQYYKKEANEDLTQSAANEGKAPEKTDKQISSGAVLGYLAAQNADLVPTTATRTYNVSKYVTPEQEARIAGFIHGYEADYNEALAIAVDEFPEISEKAAGEIALAYINASY